MGTDTQTIDILPAAEAYVAAIFHQSISKDYVYHDFQHTCAMVEATVYLAEQYELSGREMEIVQLAAWFHDTGYDEGYADHEQRSMVHAESFLRRYQYAAEAIERVKSAILATRVPQTPRNLLEEIVCDADLSHLGNAYYWDRCGRLRQELALTRQVIMSDQEWIDFEINFMLNHQYHTQAAKELFGQQKEKHVRQLLKHKERLHPDESPQDLAELREQRNKKPKKPKAPDGIVDVKALNLGRGVETMYRTTYRTHINLSSIADNKANIMLSINAIIISIIVSNLVPRLDGERHLVLPTALLILVCLVSLVFAILSTRPKVTEGLISRDDIEHKRSNLLFFGNFYKMDINDFHWGMMEMLKDADFLYSSMTRDLYFLGVVLAKKYFYLRLCYSVFMYGLIVAIAAFVLAFI